MLAIVPKSHGQLDSKLVRSFKSLASCGIVPTGNKPGHSDGWGIVSWKKDGPFYLGREPSDAYEDPKYEKACDQIDKLRLSKPIIVHLRKASIGLKIKENTHPFILGDWAFAHNGTIRKLNLKVTTDSQWFFESLIGEFKRNGLNIVRAIKEQVATIHEIYPYTSITFVLSNGKDVYAYRDCTKFKQYYGMYFTTLKDSIVLCQEKFFDSDWQELENGEMIHVDSHGTYEINRLGSPITVAS
jgi:predicted glutamine amidotransferase